MAGGIAIEVVCAISLFALLPIDLAMAGMGVFVIVLAGFLVLLGALPGQKGANRFGPPPRPGLRFGRYADPSEQTAAHFE